MKKSCVFLRENALKIINFKKKKMKILTKKQQESDGNAKICYNCNKRIEIKYLKEKKKYCKVRGYCCYTEEYRGAAHSICNLKKSA